MSNLKPNQKKLIAKIIELGNIDQACKCVQISRAAYYDWLKDETFVSELKTQQDALYNGSLVELKNLFGQAIDTYKDLLNSDNEMIRFRTATAIVDNTVKLIETKELQERIEALEKAIENKGK